jgi:hypothetical protein
VTTEHDTLANRFTYHAPKGDQPRRYERIRRAAYWFARFVCRFTPPSREREIALARLEEAVFWANAAIARNE